LDFTLSLRQVRVNPSIIPNDDICQALHDVQFNVMTDGEQRIENNLGDVWRRYICRALVPHPVLHPVLSQKA
jgi:hypothetical protein